MSIITATVNLSQLLTDCFKTYIAIPVPAHKTKFGVPLWVLLATIPNAFSVFLSCELKSFQRICLRLNKQVCQIISPSAFSNFPENDLARILGLRDFISCQLIVPHMTIQSLLTNLSGKDIHPPCNPGRDSINSQTIWRLKELGSSGQFIPIAYWLTFKQATLSFVDALILLFALGKQELVEGLKMFIVHCS